MNTRTILAKMSGTELGALAATAPIDALLAFVSKHVDEKAFLANMSKEDLVTLMTAPAPARPTKDQRAAATEKVLNAFRAQDAWFGVADVAVIANVPQAMAKAACAQLLKDGFLQKQGEKRTTRFHSA